MYESIPNELRNMEAGSKRMEPYKRGLLHRAANAIEELIRKEKFHAFLWNTIQPNEMEQYISMYNSGNIPQKPPKEETE